MLPDKLGVRAGMRVVLVGAPDRFEDALVPLPAGARAVRRMAPGTQLAVVFVMRVAELRRRWPTMTGNMTVSGAIWVAWPKRSSGVATDMTEHAVREVVLPSGWVDVKVAAIDETWSGLRCVLRVALRSPRAQTPQG